MHTLPLFLGLTLALSLPSPAAAGVHFVDDSATGGADGTSWADAFPLLQDALAVAAAGDEIWVAEGLYRPDQGALQLAGDRAASFQLQSGVRVHGGFAGSEGSLAERSGSAAATVLSGDLAGDDGPDFQNYGDNSYHVVTGSGTDATAWLDGFTVRGGNAPPSEGGFGGGMVNLNGSPTVLGCIFRDNRVQDFDDDGGRGAGVHNEGGSPLFEGCTFENNVVFGSAAAYGGAMANWDGSAVTVRDSDFRANRTENAGGLNGANGGAVACRDAEATFEGCVFEGNVATGTIRGNGGALWSQGSTVRVVRSRFVANDALGDFGTALGGAALFFGGEARFSHAVFLGNFAEAPSGSDGGAVYLGQQNVTSFDHCLFSGNLAKDAGNGSSGGGICYQSKELSLSYCTLAGNVADGTTPVSLVGGGGIQSSGNTPPVIVGSVLWGNVHGLAPGQAAQIDGIPPQIDFSCVEGWTGTFGGNGNFGQDPLFIDADGPDGIAGTPDDDLRLAPGSPCVDAGNGAAVPADAFDLDGDGDLAEVTPRDLDLLLRFVDDPATPDAVPGMAPAVDLGPYETHGAGSFYGDLASLSGSAGGTQQWAVDVGPGFAGQLYLVLGSLGGTQPGIPLAPGVVLPLVSDAYFALTLANPNLPPLQNSLGELDGAGRAFPAFLLPVGSAALAGLVAHHAVVTLDPAAPAVSSATNPVALDFTP